MINIIRFQHEKLNHFLQLISEQPSVLSLYPFTSRDLSQRSMADVVFDINDLTVLYPNIPKEVFRKHCSIATQEQQPTATGYVKHILVTQLQR